MNRTFTRDKPNGPAPSVSSGCALTAALSKKKKKNKVSRRLKGQVTKNYYNITVVVKYKVTARNRTHRTHLVVDSDEMGHRQSRANRNRGLRHPPAEQTHSFGSSTFHAAKNASLPFSDADASYAHAIYMAIMATRLTREQKQIATHRPPAVLP